MTTTLAPQEQNFILDGLDWTSYDELLRALTDRHVFVTYDRGRVELMSPSWEHDTRAEAIAQTIRIVAEELSVPIKGGGSPTFRREDLDKGLEPDRCFYVKNEAAVRGKRRLDLSVDPPPDLCIEVEITRRLMDRTNIYRELGVPELWRDNGRQLRIFVLNADHDYVQQDRSLAFPAVPLEGLASFVEWNQAMDDTSWTRRVRQWMRQHLPQE